MAHIVDYKPEFINALLEAHEAIKLFTDNNGQDLVYGKIKDAIVRSSANSRIGIALLHKPPKEVSSTEGGKGLEGEQKPVRIGNVVLPLNTSKLDPEVQANLVPSVFGLLKDGSVFPAEFAYTTDAAKYTLTPSDLAVIKEIQTILVGNTAIVAVGVTLVEIYAAGLATTQEAAVITLPLEMVDLFPADVREETAWEYSSGEANATGLLVASGGGQNFGGISIMGGYNSINLGGGGRIKVYESGFPGTTIYDCSKPGKDTQKDNRIKVYESGIPGATIHHVGTDKASKGDKTNIMFHGINLQTDGKVVDKDGDIMIGKRSW